MTPKRRILVWLKAVGGVAVVLVGAYLFFTLSAGLAKKLGRAREGALVMEVVPTGPAARSGVRGGDLIVAFGGTAVRRAGDLPRLTARAPAGSEVELTLVRDGREQTVKIRLAELPEGSVR